MGCSNCNSTCTNCNTGCNNCNTGCNCTPCDKVGPEGPSGLKGVTGNPGDVGIQGVQGDQGIQGDVGVQGFDGIDGADGNAGSQGIQGIQGVQGPPGPEGPEGDQGPPGLDDTGLNGSDGLDVDSYSNLVYTNPCPCPLIAAQGNWVENCDAECENSPGVYGGIVFNHVANGQRTWNKRQGNGYARLQYSDTAAKVIGDKAEYVGTMNNCAIHARVAAGDYVEMTAYNSTTFNRSSVGVALGPFPIQQPGATLGTGSDCFESIYIGDNTYVIIKGLFASGQTPNFI